MTVARGLAEAEVIKGRLDDAVGLNFDPKMIFSELRLSGCTQ